MRRPERIIRLLIWTLFLPVATLVVVLAALAALPFLLLFRGEFRVAVDMVTGLGYPFRKLPGHWRWALAP